MPFQGVNSPTNDNPGRRFACPGLGDPLGFQPALAKMNRTQIEFLQNTLNRLFERALHAVLFTLMAAKAINAHQCFALRVHSTLWNGH